MPGSPRQNHPFDEADELAGALLASAQALMEHATAMPQQLSNTELSPADIPSFKEAWTRIEPFALTFDGFKYWGSVEKCAEVAHEKRMATLTELRTCLFYEARKWKQAGKSPDIVSLRYIRALVYAIREKVSAGQVR